MKTRIMLGIGIVILLSLVQITLADFPSEQEDDESTTNFEQRQLDYILDPALFDPADPNQIEAFKNAYDEGKIDLDNPQHRESVGKYISSNTEGISAEDANLASEFFTKETGKNFNIDPNGNIKFDGESIITSDGKKHMLTDLAGMQDVIGIESTSEGKLKLITTKGDIFIDQTTLTQNEDGDFIAEDGTIISFEGNNGGSTYISAEDDKTVINCEEGCNFKIGNMDITLMKGGSFKHLGDNRYNVNKGTVKVGKDMLTGNVEFSMDADNSKIDLSKKIDLNKYFLNPEGTFLGISYGGPIGSRAQLSKDEHPEIKGLQDDLYFSNGKGHDNKVGICLYCEDFTPEEYDGSVNFENYENNEIQQVPKANIKGKIAVGFGREGKIDTFHEGFDENLEASYFPDGEGIGVLQLSDCGRCKLYENAGVQIINGRYYELENKRYHPSKTQMFLVPELGISQIHVKELRPLLAKGVGLYTLEAVFPEGASIPDSHKYAKEKDRANSLGSNYNVNYIRLEPNERVKENMKLMNDGEYGYRDIFTQHSTFQYDSNKYRVQVNNLYVTTRYGNSMIDQITVTQSGFYENFRMRESTKEIIGQVNKEGIQDSDERIERFNELSQMKQHEVFMETKKQFLSGIIDAGAGKYEDNPTMSNIIRDMLDTYPIDEAKAHINEYSAREKGAEDVYNMMAEGKTLEQIYRQDRSDPNIKSFFNEPYSVYHLNEEIIKNAEGAETVQIYEYTEEGLTLIRKEIQTDEASKFNTLQIVEMYQEESDNYFRDLNTASKIAASEVRTEMGDKEFRQIEKKVEKGKFNVISQSQYEIAALDPYVAENAIVVKLKNGKYMIVDEETKNMIDNDEIDPDTLGAYVESDDLIRQDDFSKNLKIFTEAMIPKSAVELALNIIPEIGMLGKGLSVISHAKGVIATTKAVAAFTGKFASAGIFGFGIGGTTKHITGISADVVVLTEKNLQKINHLSSSLKDITGKGLVGEELSKAYRARAIAYKDAGNLEYAEVFLKKYKASLLAEGDVKEAQKINKYIENYREKSFMPELRDNVKEISGNKIYDIDLGVGFGKGDDLVDAHAKIVDHNEYISLLPEGGGRGDDAWDIALTMSDKLGKPLRFDNIDSLTVGSQELLIKQVGIVDNQGRFVGWNKDLVDIKDGYFWIKQDPDISKYDYSKLFDQIETVQ